MADAAEFQLAAHTLGIAHPTGYPLYLILSWLWSHLLPFGDPAFRVNLLSAVFASAAAGLCYLLVLRVLRGTLQGAPGALLRAVAVIPTLSLALSQTFWSQALRAEVYALNSLFVVLTLFLLLRWSESRSSSALQLCALVYGLSLTHHATMLLFLPAFVLFVWMTDHSVFRNLGLMPALLILAVAPLLLYLYIPWRAPATPYLYIELTPDRTLELHENTLRGFLGFVAGEMFVGELGYQASLLQRLSMALDLLARQFGIAGVTLGCVGVAKLAIGWRNTYSRRLLALLGLSYGALVGFTLFYHVGDIQVFYTPSYIVFVVWIALGMAWIVEAALRMRVRVLARVPRAAWALAALFALLPVSLLWGNYAKVDRSADYRARVWAEGILSQPIPQGSILISNDRNEITPLLYLQHVEGKRPDLLTMFPLMLPGEEYSNVVRVIDGVLEVGRPLYLVKPMPGLELKYALEPSGALVEVTGPAVSKEPDNVTELVLGDTLTLVGYDLDPAVPSPGKELHVSLHWQVEEIPEWDHHTYVRLLDEHGQAIARSDHRPGQEYYPSSLWQPGETVLDVHILAVPAGTEAESVTLVAGAYEYPSLAPLGGSLTLGEVPIAP
jgi:hypothetical protein